MLLALAAGFAWVRSRPRGPAPVTVYAAASLKEAVSGIAGEWTKRTGRPVRLQFGATPTLARQIREGAPADLFLAADPEWLDRAGTLERFDWLGNRLACVVRRGSPKPDLAGVGSLALAGGEVPAGKYAKAALASLGIPLPPRVVYGASVRDVLSKVSQGAAEAGIVYATDVPIDPGTETAFLLPEESHPPIRYAVGLVTPQGRELYAAFREPWALEAALRRGFQDLD